MADSLANFFGGGMVLIIGLVLAFVKGSEGMIAGYNKMSEEEQAKWNVTKMRTFLGGVLISASFVLNIGGVLALFNIHTDLAVTVSWVLFAVLILSSVAYLNMSSKFKNS